MSRDERLFRLFLRVFAVMAIPALLCAFLPYAWMDAIHGWLGLGKLPSEPIVGYLARSASILYAFLLGFLWVASNDLRRHSVALRYYGAASVAFGVLITGVDLHEGLPTSWVVSEGPVGVVLGVVVLVFSYRVERAGPPEEPSTQGSSQRDPQY